MAAKNGMRTMASILVALAAAGAVAQPAAPSAPSGDPALLQSLRIATRIGPDSLTVGDHATVEIHVEAPAGTEVRFPERLADEDQVELVGVEVVPPSSDPKSAPSGNPHWVGRYTLAVFRVGSIVLPPWPIAVQQADRRAVAATDSIRIDVQTVLDDSLAAADLRDLKPQAKLPVPIWPWIVGGALLALLIVLAVLWWRRRRRPRAAVVPMARVRAPHELALEALRRLELRALPVDGKYEQFHVQLSEILRRYLEDGFGLAALEETTEEILFDLERQGFDRTTVRQVGALCAESDLVKFAKHEPTIEECGQALLRVRDFVVASAGRTVGGVATASASATGDGAAGGAA